MKYKPLPNYITVRESKIHGLGLFATKEIRHNTLIGIILVPHCMHHGDPLNDDFIRTPLGGFGNHSDDPNCRKILYNDVWWIESIKDIEPDEEITWRYTLYKIK